MPRATTLLPSAVYAVLAIADSVAAGKSGRPAARRLRCVLKPALMPALATAFLDGTRGRRARADTNLLRTGPAVARAFSWGGDVALLGTKKFLLTEPRPVLESVVMTTYTAGQGLVATGVASAT